MATFEKEIEYSKHLSFDSINQTALQLDKSEATDESTDLSVSVKLVDNEGDVLLFLEAMPKCIDENESIKNIQGCYIRRFEYVYELLTPQYQSVLFRFIQAFVTHVKFNLVPLNSGEFLTNYQYVWADKDAKESCIIAHVLELSAFQKIANIVIYKGELKRG